MSVFSSSTYNDKYIKSNLTDEPDICIICWMPEEKNNTQILFSDFYHINFNCKCKPKIHNLCLNTWVQKHQSCPICRKKIVVNSNTTNIIIGCYLCCRQSALFFFKILSYASFINTIVISTYFMYYMFFMSKINYTNEHYTDDTYYGY